MDSCFEAWAKTGAANAKNQHLDRFGTNCAATL
jgi:hypothetical protein